MLVRDYRPKDIIIIFYYVPIVGYAPDSFVTIEADEPRWRHESGIYGETCRWINNNYNGTITLELVQSSPSNTFLSAVAILDQTLPGIGLSPIFIADLNGSSLAMSPEAWVEQISSRTFGKESGTVRWVIHATKLEFVSGGNWASLINPKNLLMQAKSKWNY